ncbi:hypothetical protein BT93_D0644 [Corymbia citriodora subsp. variegata]|nr:hypothetical protein BT93_D0644 [Corymbia citriodora subsp. variegata]
MEALVMFTASLLLFVIAFSSLRRCYNNEMFRLVISTAYTLSTYALTYVVGFMHNAPFHNDLFPIWAMFLLLILGCVDISAYRLEDNDHWNSHRWQFGIRSGWMLVLIGLYVRKNSGAVTAIACVALFLFSKHEERVWAMMAASRTSLVRNAKVVADYMRMEHENEGVSRWEVGMRKCTYLVSGEKENSVNDIFLAIKRCLGMKKAAPAPHYRMTLDKDQVITIDKVWECEGRLLSSQGDPSNTLKDKCLSFALFKLLRLRYADYPLPQQAHCNTMTLIHNGLFSQEDGYERAFRVIEVELMFLFEFFYTKYGTIFRPVWLLNRLMDIASVIIGIWATISLLKHYEAPNKICRLPTIPNWLNVDVLLRQFYFMVFSEWAKVKLICKYVQKKSWQGNACIEMMVRVLCKAWIHKPWERKLRQYSFLKSYSYEPCKLFNNNCMAAYIDQTRDGQTQNAPINLHKEVKRAVFHALKLKCNAKLDNGQASLRVNNVPEWLSWACPLETKTHVIMVWHIATSFCEHRKPVKSDLPGTSNFLVATSLSKYMAYLVAFAPQLLPDHTYDTENVFDQAIIEARIFFYGCEKMEDRFKEMEKARSCSVQEETVISRGARLGNQLVNDIKEEEMIWKTLADFWVELVLYVAPSNNAKAHAEHLTKGGEFVTHLWAMLYHVGIERDHPSF